MINPNAFLRLICSQQTKETQSHAYFSHLSECTEIILVVQWIPNFSAHQNDPDSLLKHTLHYPNCRGFHSAERGGGGGLIICMSNNFQVILLLMRLVWAPWEPLLSLVHWFSARVPHALRSTLPDMVPMYNHFCTRWILSWAGCAVQCCVGNTGNKRAKCLSGALRSIYERLVRATNSSSPAQKS